MADNVSDSVTINASPAEVMAVIAHWAHPQWSDGFTGVEIISTHDDGAAEDVAFTISTPVDKDTYEISYIWNGDESVSWTLNSDAAGKPKSSLMKKLDGTYTLAPAGEGTRR